MKIFANYSNLLKTYNSSNKSTFLAKTSSLLSLRPSAFQVEKNISSFQFQPRRFISNIKPVSFISNPTKSALTMDIAGTIMASTIIDLTEREKQLFDFFLEYIAAKEVKVTPRSAGGWVRDKLLRKECHDIDITLDTMTGEQFLSGLLDYLKEIGKESLISGHGVIKSNPDKSKHLETVTFKLFGYDIDIANLRHEEYATSSRIPTMKFGTPLQDAERRDLTINSMFYNLLTKEVEDFTGKGLNDLRDGIIRTPLEPIQTFVDDPLRVLRTFRFATKLGFSVIPEIAEAIKNPAIRDALEKKVSRERVRTELQKMLIDPNAARGLSLIFEQNLWSVVFQMPEKCVELQNKDFYLEKQIQSYYLGIESTKRLKQVFELPTLKAEYDPVDIQLLLLLIAVSFPYANFSFKSGKTPISLPLYLTFESLKFPDKGLKVCTIVANACESALRFQEVVRNKLEDEFNEIVQIIKKQGNSWELALFIAMLSDSKKAKADKVFEVYQNLQKFIYDRKIQNIYAMKPLIDGKEIMSVFKLDKQGPVVGKINNNMFLWQARNMDKGKEELLEEILKDVSRFTS